MIFAEKKLVDINSVWKGEKVIIMGGIMNYENIAQFLKSHAGRDDKL